MRRTMAPISLLFCSQADGCLTHTHKGGEPQSTFGNNCIVVSDRPHPSVCRVAKPRPLRRRHLLGGLRRPREGSRCACCWRPPCWRQLPRPRESLCYHFNLFWLGLSFFVGATEWTYSTFATGWLSSPISICCSLPHLCAVNTDLYSSTINTTT